MEQKIRFMLESMDYNHLVNLNDKAKNGHFDFNMILSQTIKAKEKENNKCCSVCGNEMDPSSMSNFTIMFGSEDFKKKASFCALDCMEYFISKLKALKTESKIEEKTKIEN